MTSGSRLSWHSSRRQHASSLLSEGNLCSVNPNAIYPSTLRYTLRHRGSQSLAAAVGAVSERRAPCSQDHRWSAMTAQPRVTQIRSSALASLPDMLSWTWSGSSAHSRSAASAA